MDLRNLFSKISFDSKSKEQPTKMTSTQITTANGDNKGELCFEQKKTAE